MEDVSVPLTVLFSVFGVITGGIGTGLAVRKFFKDKDHNEGQQIGVVLYKLEDIGNDVRDIKKDYKANTEVVQHIQIQLTEVKGSDERAHKRIDELKQEMDKMKGVG